METCESIKEIKFPQEHENNSIIILDGLNEKEINNDNIQTVFKHGRHNNLSIFIISQEYYELTKRTIRANGNVFLIIYSNLTISEMFKIFIKTKLQGI